jgi:kynurenine formamidase
MKLIDLTIPLGIGTPAWPTYEPLQIKYFKRLAPNGANGQLLTHSNHLGTHLDGEIHFYTPGKDIAALDLDFLVHEAAIADLSDVCGPYDVYTSKMVEERVEVRTGDILIVHTGFHHYGWDQPTADEIAYMVKHPGPDREFAQWAKRKKLRWIGVDCGSADHPMNTIIRDWMPRQARQADAHFRAKYGKPLAEFFDDSKYQLMHLEMFPFGIVHAECLGGEIDLLLNRRVTIGMFPWRFVDGESSIARCVAMLDDEDHAALMKKRDGMPKTKFGDAFDPAHVERINELSKVNLG